MSNNDICLFLYFLPISVEWNRRVPPVSVRISYALGIITLFPNLKDKASPTGYVSIRDALFIIVYVLVWILLCF